MVVGLRRLDETLGGIALVEEGPELGPESLARPSVPPPENASRRAASFRRFGPDAEALRGPAFESDWSILQLQGHWFG